MNREEAILHMTLRREELKNSVGDLDEDIKAFDMAIEALEQEPCEMTAEEYRQRMIQAFHNAGTDELIAVCVFPTAKEFEYLEWLLKNHYKKEPCDDAISRQAAIRLAEQGQVQGFEWQFKQLVKLPSVSTEKTGHWIKRENEFGLFECSICKDDYIDQPTCMGKPMFKFCPSCGAKMGVEE